MARATTAPLVVDVNSALRMIRDGRFRFTPYRRSFVWTPKQTIALLESIDAGLPIGAIIVREAAAEAERIRIGPVHIDAPEDPVALWVVDGAQRLGALAGALLSDRRAVQPSALVFYDLKTETFQQIGHNEPVPPHWLPMAALAGIRQFSDWLTEQGAYVESYTEQAADLRARILGYQLTFLRVLGLTPEDGYETFVRLNANGSALTAADVFNARNRGTGSDGPADLSTLAEKLTRLGFGRLPEDAVHRSMLAITTPGGSDPSVLDDPSTAYEQTLSALDAAVTFLREEARIPHVEVWRPHLGLLPTLASFFHLNPAASVRARILLRRWVWRAMGTERPMLKVAERNIQGRDSIDASALLKYLPSRRPGRDYLSNVGTKLALAALGPRSFVTGMPLDLTELLNETGPGAFQQLGGGALVLSPPDDGPLEEIVLAAADRADVLASHAMTPEILDLLTSGELREFRQRRKQLLAERLIDVAYGLAEWGASDRPGISELLVSDDSSSGSDLEL